MPRSPTETIPLSFAQRRLWFLHQLDPDSPIYNRPLLVRLSGILNFDALERAVNEIVRRHEVLRTSFRAEDGNPKQLVAADLHIHVRFVDLTDLAVGERRRTSRLVARDEARRPFDLKRGPLIRALLIRTGLKAHDFLTTIHHAAFDGWSSQIFLRELSVLYEAFSAGGPSPLPEIPFQYAEFAVSQRRANNRDELSRQLSFWRERLAGLSHLDLSSGNRGSSDHTFSGGRKPFRLPAELSDALRTLAREERATLFMLLLAAFKLLLHRYTGQEDIALGCPVAGRNRAEVEGLIGCFVNTLVLRSDLSGSPSFRELLARVRRTTVEALSNQDVPFERVVEELQPARSLTHAPFFEVFFQLRNYPRAPRTAKGLVMEEVSLDMEAAGLDLTLELSEEQAGLSGSFIYNRELFVPEAVAHMADQYEWLLRQIADAPDRSVGEYSLVTRRARAILPDPQLCLEEPSYEPVTELVRARAHDAPESVAVRHAGHSWSYGHLEERFDRIARHLVADGVRAGEPVGIFGPRSFGVTASMLAVLAAGGVILPIGIDIPVERRRTMLRDAGVRIVVYVGNDGAEAGRAEQLDEHRVLRVDPETAAFLDDLLDGSKEYVNAELPHIEPSDPAYIFFTSGTTGRPKGVLGVHKGLSHFLSWQRETFGIGPSERCAHLTSLSFDVVLRDIFLPLTSGAKLCIPPGEIEPAAVLPWLISEAATVVHTVPSIAQSWLSQAAAAAPSASLRLTFFAGEPLTDVLVSAWRSRLGDAGAIVNLYGPTETTLVKCAYPVPEVVSPGIQPVGRALPHAQALVVNRANRLCGIHERGEVILRTAFGTRGYINRPDENQRSFIANPFREDPADVVYRTGDAGHYLPDGLLMVTGRLDHQIKIRGVRIEPEEIAVTLARREGVTSAVVVGRKDENGESFLVAYVVARSEDLNAAVLRSYLAGRLPAPMIPGHFVFLDALPLTPTGKVDRSGLPEPDLKRPASTYAAPQTPEEETIAEIWSDVLGRDRVGIHDDFFEMGGHSLVILQIASRMYERLGVDVPVHQFFETPTVSQLAGVVRLGRTAPVYDEQIQDLLHELEGLSDEQITLLLGNDG